MATTMMVVPLIPPVILPTGVRVDIKKYFQISRWCLCYGDTLIVSYQFVDQVTL